MAKTGIKIAGGVAALAAAAFALSLAFGDRPRAKLDPEALAEFFVEACLTAAGSPERAVATAKERGWSGGLDRGGWTASYKGVTFSVRVHAPDRTWRRLTDCAVDTDFPKVNGPRATLADFLTALRRELAKMPPAERLVLAQDPSQQRQHYDGYLRFDTYRLTPVRSESTPASGNAVLLQLTVSIKHDQVGPIVAQWPASSP